MDTTDKQNEMSFAERKKIIDELFEKYVTPLQKEVAELRGERLRLRDAVNERMKDYRNGLLHNPPQYKVMDKGAIIALEYVLSLLK